MLYYVNRRTGWQYPRDKTGKRRNPRKKINKRFVKIMTSIKALHFYYNNRCRYTYLIYIYIWRKIIIKDDHPWYILYLNNLETIWSNFDFDFRYLHSTTSINSVIGCGSALNMSHSDSLSYIYKQITFSVTLTLLEIDK